LTPTPLGLIAGGGDLPAALAHQCVAAGRPLFVVRLRGFAEPSLARFPGAEIGVAELGAIFAVLRSAGCRAVCMAGTVARPDFAALKPDLRGLRALPGAIAAAGKGDDALLRFLLAEFEREGFAVEGAHEVAVGLTLPEGPLGRHAPDAAHRADIDRAIAVARAVGALDVGQGAVVCDNLVLAVEAQEGTDAMLARVATLSPAIRGAPASPRGVLAKALKPTQDARMDMPVIGPGTIEAAAAAGLAGVAGEAGRVLLLEREKVIEVADRLGLFVVGVEAS
jgi:DUF1009 family protein